MKNFTLILAAACLFTMHSCNNGEGHKEQTAELKLQPNDSLFHIQETGYNFNIILPKDLMIESTPAIHVNSATGELNIQLGNQFWIVASMEKADMTAIKSELSEDLLFTNRIVEENPSSVMYQRILPDGTAYDYNYKCSNDIGGKSYFFRTSEEGEFNMESVGRMKLAISTVHTSV